jgi:hypothetical protein
VSCGDDDDEKTTEAPKLTLSADFSIPKDSFPEDIDVYGNEAFISNWAKGGIIKVNLADGTTEQFVENTDEERTAWWAVSVIPEQGLVTVLTHPPFDFNTVPSTAGVVRGYNITTGELEKSWPLPAGLVGNGMKYDGSRYLYINEISADAKIVRVDTQAADGTEGEVWVGSGVFTTQGFGHGGLAVVNNAVYTALNQGLYKIPIEADGSAGTPVQVAMTKEDGSVHTQGCDGMVAIGNDIYMGYNDAQDSDNVGAVFKVALGEDGTTATATLVVDKLDDPSGITIFKGAKNYLLINLSKFGLLLGNGFNPTAALDANTSDSLTVKVVELP